MHNGCAFGNASSKSPQLLKSGDKAEKHSHATPLNMSFLTDFVILISSSFDPII